MGGDSKERKTDERTEDQYTKEDLGGIPSAAVVKRKKKSFFLAFTSCCPKAYAALK